MLHSPKQFNVRYEAIFKSSINNSIRVWLSQPLSSYTQKVESVSISPKPQNYYKDAQGNKILYYEFNGQTDYHIQMDVKITLWKKTVNLKDHKPELPSASTKLFQLYTKSETFLEQTPSIRQLAKVATNDGSDVVANIQFIFNFIVKNFTYCYPVKQRGVKCLNLNNLVGDCGEYSSLFVTMCRILKIPARNNTGFVIFPKQKKIVEHAWASIYLKPYGWLDFDTQYASLEKNTNIYFARTNDYRIAFTNGFNIPLKPTIPKNFKINYWNELGMPLTHTEAQTLQPIIYASQKEINFKDSVELL